MMGRAFLNQGQYDEAIKYLMKANEYCRESGQLYGDEIFASLRQAKRAKFRQEEEKRIQQEIELQSYLNNLIKNDIISRTNKLLVINFLFLNYFYRKVLMEMLKVEIKRKLTKKLRNFNWRVIITWHS